MTKTNPFATRYIRPGELPYIYPERLSAAALVEQLQGNNWRGQIIGPHGSGKSTLVADLTPALEDAGRVVVYRQVKPTDADERGQDYLELVATASGQTMLIIDGYEQLSWWTRRRIESGSGGQGCGLLITAHRDMGLPALLQLQPSLETAEQVVQQLLPPGDRTITRGDILAAWNASGENIREMLFKLFDVYQSRDQSPRP
jgi:hypothetical protein